MFRCGEKGHIKDCPKVVSASQILYKRMSSLLDGSFITKVTCELGNEQSAPS